MNKKLVYLLICSLIVLVSSTPIDTADDGGNRTNEGGIRYTEPGTDLPIISTVPNLSSQHVDDMHNGDSKASSTASTGPITYRAAIVTTPSPGDSNATNDTDTTTQPPKTTTATPTTTSPTTTTPTPTTTEVTTTTQPPTTTTITTSPETTKPPTTSTSSPTTTAAAATTTVPTPTASPSKDRRFDGPSFIGGIVLSLGIMAIGFVAFKFYKARTERNYHTL